jgi:hypothetical protein
MLIAAALAVSRGAEVPIDTGLAVPLQAYPLAKCLDGTAGRYYIARGAEATKFTIFHQGGGYCTSIADCAHRATTYLGSTKDDPSTFELSEAYFASDPKLNPLMHNWTKIYVRYCDGGYFSGDRSDTIYNGSTQLFFRGRFITEAVVADLNAHHGLDSATDVAIAGCSAGAIRVYAHLDQLAAMMPHVPRIFGFPDSGFYMDVDMFTSLKHFVVSAKGQNATALLNPACRAAHVGQEEKCLVASVVVSSVSTPIFAWQSQYDADQRGCEMTQACADSARCVNEYGTNLTSTLKTLLLGLGSSSAGRNMKNGKKNGAFLDSCSRHCLDRTWPTGTIGTKVGGDTPLQALAKWAAAAGSGEQRQLWEQGAEYPCSTCCG